MVIFALRGDLRGEIRGSSVTTLSNERTKVLVNELWLSSRRRTIQMRAIVYLLLISGLVYIYTYSMNVSFAKSNQPIEIGVVAGLLYTSPSPRDQRGSRMPSSA